jgi:predicted DNA-binding protein (MmcQ/YjbR family)
LDGTVPDDEIMRMVQHSYEQVVAGLTRAARQGLIASS